MSFYDKNKFIFCVKPNNKKSGLTGFNTNPNMYISYKHILNKTHKLKDTQSYGLVLGSAVEKDNLRHSGIFCLDFEHPTKWKDKHSEKITFFLNTLLNKHYKYNELKDNFEIVFKQLEKKFNTFTVKSGNNGRHFYFKIPTQLLTIHHTGVYKLNNNVSQEIKDTYFYYFFEKTKYDRHRGLFDSKMNGLMVAPNQQINNKQYQIIKDKKPVLLKNNIIKIIMEHYFNYNIQKTNVNIQKSYNTTQIPYDYDLQFIGQEYIIKKLETLPDNIITDFYLWTQTTCYGWHAYALLVVQN